MTRGHEHEIEIQAPAEAVWRALTDGEELVRWFAEDARTTPGTRAFRTRPTGTGCTTARNQGWEIFLRTLRHYLERHPGAARRTIYWMAKLESVEDGLWERLTRPDGPLGALAGDALYSRPGTALLAVAPELDDGLVALALEGNLLWCTVSAYGDARDRLDELEAPVHAEIEGLPAST